MKYKKNCGRISNLQGAKNKAEQYFNKTLESVANLPNNEFFVDFAKMLYDRNK